MGYAQRIEGSQIQEYLPSSIFFPALTGSQQANNVEWILSSVVIQI